jgi:nicotinamide-nucleotide amidase
MDDYLVVNETCLADLKAYMMKMNRTITENNYKQANMPSRAVVLPNDAGTAPGFLLEKDGKRIIAMPGPPREMTRMFEKQVKPILAAHQDSVISYRILRAFGLGESRMETELLPLINVQTDPTIATYAKEGECSLRIASKRATQQEAEAAVDDMIEKVDALIGDYIYSHDNEELVQVVGRLLLEKNITISCCESCTGGLFAGALTQVPGISDVFNRGIVTYTNQAKVDELGVSADTIENYGAVSQETAAEMASGLYRITGSDICISITGVAGPEPSEGKPVGLVYIGMTWQGATTVQKVQMRNVNREWNRHYAVLSMLHEVYRRIIM